MTSSGMQSSSCSESAAGGGSGYVKVPAGDNTACSLHVYRLHSNIK